MLYVWLCAGVSTSRVCACTLSPFAHLCWYLKSGDVYVHIQTCRMICAAHVPVSLTEADPTYGPSEMGAHVA